LSRNKQCLAKAHLILARAQRNKRLIVYKKKLSFALSACFARDKVSRKGASDFSPGAKKLKAYFL